jgi:hypothetical protein
MLGHEELTAALVRNGRDVEGADAARLVDDFSVLPGFFSSAGFVNKIQDKLIELDRCYRWR